MPVYEYKALDKRGKTLTGIVDADSSQEARGKLREQEVYITDLSDTLSMPGKNRTAGITLFTRISPIEVSILIRQISTLLNAGIPLVEALSAVIDQIDNKGLERILSQVRESVREGRSFADSLSPHTRAFSPLMVNMIRSGESSGSLEIVLLRLADFLEQQVMTKRKIQSALIYPAVIVSIAFCILLFLMTYVVPSVTKIFSDMKQTLPIPTAVLIAISSFIRSYWWLFLLLFAAAFTGIKAYIKTEEGRIHFDQFKLKMPIFGSLYRKIAISRFSRTLGTLLKNGVPLLNSLDIVKNVVGNKLLERTIEEARTHIGEGSSIHEPLRRSGVFPPILIHMINVGEKSGTLEEMLNKVADITDNEIDTTVNTLTSLLEPFMIVGLALVVGFIVISILLPIFEINQLIH
ncbi:MAG: type II secretion system protein GspF [Nitrospirae bacterium CG_4_9_14_3_um_filter_53_35]|nr:MAG: type II secretion system protein GspF [Nitrospirae bacterium CG2_30_53_67]PIS38210.1 MAG: type II secretion system protein GspF [Nitrospirae bacterium CG08_land_8_20_14_0_20_52_24]PIV82862.1 MAG: type II secretion system protein GspF [Nitrospirae bacterium CG17_big_fil_post_rev_8_21_14_2_50_50_9]PIW85131.1 MAG: type II secretion system protein GspF [Nitrospirae bacterium CG_4_8_14_3_um_filter_50_41]PIX84730.1 MAG: type II secretion system protein GspF [Nitrospirae bacterium CG_4_10_14_3